MSQKLWFIWATTKAEISFHLSCKQRLRTRARGLCRLQKESAMFLKLNRASVARTHRSEVAERGL